MSEELKIQDAVDGDNPITKKIFDNKTESVYYYCNNLSHNNAITVGPVTNGANVLISNSTHFPFDTIHGNITFNVSGLHETHFKDGYKGPANNIHLNPSGFSSNINFVNIEETSGKWVDLSVFHLISMTAGHKAMIRLNSSGMLDGGPYSQLLDKKKSVELGLTYIIYDMGIFAGFDSRENRIISIRVPPGLQVWSTGSKR